ncbi:hypothetical protein [Bradyrhizobium prioriisuperbiae]|uniref:hypothetical protein n=1 Tax=Bradyrhizobium prioriisuperbiae TaxID=2854389 RepID=UPI0028E6CF64|nr:hypothetical protein [Bradyrhizobium prioritasuperba]
MSRLAELAADVEVAGRIAAQTNPQWQDRGFGDSRELDLGTLRLAITNQSDRHCGWCWHVSVGGIYGGDTIEQGGGMASADEAKRAVEAWTRTFCEKTLAAIVAAERA